MVWYYFLAGAATGAFAALVVSLFFLRKWMVKCHQDEAIINALLSRLASTDKKRCQYRRQLDETLAEVDDLRNEKLRNWDIPDEF